MFCCCKEETVETETAQEPVVPAVELLQAEEPAAWGKVEEPQAPQEFQALLQRVGENSPYGWVLDMLSRDALYIDSLAGDASAPVATYNRSASAGEDIRAGDYITRVNGKAGSAKELSDLLRKGLQSQVTIQRVATYVVELSTGDGMLLNHTPKGKTLCIVGVRDGVLQEQAPQVSQGHRILSVNGKGLSPKDMIQELKGSSLKIDILRAPVV